MSKAELFQWVIYENPADHPGKFVVRRFSISGGGIRADARCVVCEDLEEAREVVPEGLFNLGRYPQDEPQVKEVWV